MVLDIKVKSEIKKKSGLFDLRKDQIKARIVKNIDIAKEKLEMVKKELLDEVENEFGQNPFEEFLAGNIGDYADDDIKSVLSIDIPECFGPDEKVFSSLFEGIESLKLWQRKAKKVNFELIPQNLKCTNVSWDSADISWDDVKCECMYEIKLGLTSSPNEIIYHSLKPEFTLLELEPETKYQIYVRAITSQNTDTYWSNPITVKACREFSKSVWKECPDYVDDTRKYTIDDKNPRIITSISDNYCTIIGDIPLPLNKVISWDIKILKSRGNNGSNIFIGVAPFE